MANGPVGNFDRLALTGGADIRRVKATLSDAQIKALPTTPITLVAAQGSGTLIVPLDCFVVLDPGGGAYTNINTSYGAFPQLMYNNAGRWARCAAFINDSSLATPLTGVTTYLGGTAKIMRPMLGNYEAVNSGAASGLTEWVINVDNDGTAGQLNQPLTISADNNGSGAYTGGNAANSLQVYLVYYVETIA